MENCVSRPLSSDEINNIMYQMIEVRAQQDAEFHDRLAEATGTPKQPISFDRPLSGTDICNISYKMIEVRAQENAEFRARRARATISDTPIFNAHSALNAWYNMCVSPSNRHKE